MSKKPIKKSYAEVSPEDIAFANRLRDEALLLYKDFSSLDEVRLRTLIEISGDAVSKFGASNHAKKIELKEIIRAAEHKLPVDSFTSLMGRIEWLVMGWTRSSRIVRYPIYLAVLAIPAWSMVKEIPFDHVTTSIADRYRTHILVWRVGSPYLDGTPAITVPTDIDLRAKELGYKISSVGVPAQGFADRLRKAIREGTAPDIIALDNYGLINGVATQKERFDGIVDDSLIGPKLVEVSENLASLNPNSSGFVFLVSSSHRSEEARNLANLPVGCKFGEAQQALMEAAHRIPVQMQQTLIEGAKQFASCDPSIGEYGSTNVPSSFLCKSEPKPMAVTSENLCSIEGNSHMSFAVVRVAFNGEKHMGQRDVFVGAYSENGAGHLLLVTDRGYITENFANAAVDAPARIVRSSLASQNECQTSPIEPPEQAKVLTPAGTEFHLTSFTQFPSFEWTASPSSALAFQIAEFQIGSDFTLPLFLSGGNASAKAVEKIAPSLYLGNKDGNPRWRIISVNKCGSFAATPYQSYNELLELQNVAHVIPVVFGAN